MTEHLCARSEECQQTILDKDNKYTAHMGNLRFAEARMGTMREEEIAELHGQFKNRRHHQPEQFAELKRAYDSLSEQQARALASLQLSN